MQVGISSASLYPQQHTETAIVNIAAMGCRNIEVFLQTASEYRSQYVRRLARLCGLLGVDVWSLHAASSQFEPLLFYSYPRQVRDGRTTLFRILDAAAMLKVRYYVFHGPLRVANLNREQLLEGLAWVAETAAQWGIGLALENVSWGAGWHPQVFRWLQGQKVENLYFTFDSKQANRSGFGAEEFIAAMAPGLVNVHISDSSSRSAGILPGEGSTDFVGLARLLKAAGYDGPVILEVYGTKVASTAHLAKGWRHIKSVFT